MAKHTPGTANRGKGAQERRRDRRAAEFGGKPKPGTPKDKRLKENQKPASAERAALDRMRETLQLSPTCQCGHDLSDHTGADGPCNYEDGRGVCSCSGYSEVQDEAAADGAAFSLSFPPEAMEEATALLLSRARITATGDAPPQPDIENTVRLRFEHFVVGLNEELAAGDPAATVEPGETLPAPNPTVLPPIGNTGGAMQWSAIFAPEGVLTDDGRAFAPGAIGWRNLPLTLMAMIETTEGGHIGATLCGRIDNIWRDEAAGLIRASGVFDDGEYGQEIARLVADRTLSGLSVDLVIRDFEMGPRSDWFDENGNWAPKPEASSDEDNLLDLLYGTGDENDPTIYVITDADIGMATVCPMPAFSQATIETGASLVAGASPALWTVTQQAGFVVVSVPRVAPATGETGEAIEVELGEEATLEAGLTAAAAGLAPTDPPAEWFENPGFTELTPLTIDDDGRIYGHAAEWGSCHIAFPNECITPPHSKTGYAYFRLGEVACDGGAVRVPAGKITFDTGHASHKLGRAEATRHYDDTGTVAADVAAGEDEFGIWFAGAVRPDLAADDVRKLRAAVLSGDWRNVDGNLELVALLAVNVPGFPVPRTRALVAAGDDGQHPLALIAAGIVVGHDALPEDVDDDTLEVAMERLRARADVRFASLADRARAQAA